jgi:hypothetical protein
MCCMAKVVEELSREWRTYNEAGIGFCYRLSTTGRSTTGADHCTGTTAAAFAGLLQLPPQAGLRAQLRNARLEQRPSRCSQGSRHTQRRTRELGAPWEYGQKRCRQPCGRKQSPSEKHTHHTLHTPHHTSTTPPCAHTNNADSPHMRRGRRNQAPQAVRQSACVCPPHPVAVVPVYAQELSITAAMPAHPSRQSPHMRCGPQIHRRRAEVRAYQPR